MLVHALACLILASCCSLTPLLPLPPLDLLQPPLLSSALFAPFVVMGANQSLLALSNSVQALAYKQYTAADHSFWNEVSGNSATGGGFDVDVCSPLECDRSSMLALTAALLHCCSVSTASCGPPTRRRSNCGAASARRCWCRFAMRSRPTSPVSCTKSSAR